MAASVRRQIHENPHLFYRNILLKNQNIKEQEREDRRLGITDRITYTLPENDPHNDSETALLGIGAIFSGCVAAGIAESRVGKALWFMCALGYTAFSLDSYLRSCHNLTAIVKKVATSVENIFLEGQNKDNINIYYHPHEELFVSLLRTELNERSRHLQCPWKHAFKKLNGSAPERFR